MSERQHFEVMGLGGPDRPGGIAISDLIGYTAVDRNGYRIGEVADVFVDDLGEARYLGIETGTLGVRRITVPIEELDVADVDGERALVLPYDRELLSGGPAYDSAEELSFGREREIYGHYGRPGYWEIVDQRQSTPSPTPEVARADAAEATPEAIRAGDVAARQTPPTPTPEIAMAEVEDAVRRGEDPAIVRVKRFGR